MPGRNRSVRRGDVKPEFAKATSGQGETSWAFRNLLHFPRLGVYFSLIPKNACTSTFAALAKAEGGLADWFLSGTRIHNLHDHFRAYRQPHEFRDGDLRLILLREPVERLASAISDKLFQTSSDKRFQLDFFSRTLRKPAADLSLRDIIRFCDTCPPSSLEAHFAPQPNFVFFDEYTHVVMVDQQLNALDLAGRRIKLGTMNTGAPTSGYEIQDMTLGDIWARRRDGALPSRDSLMRMIRAEASTRGNISNDVAFWTGVAGQRRAQG